jgi:hypothetical protein
MKYAVCETSASANKYAVSIKSILPMQQWRRYHTNGLDLYY